MTCSRCAISGVAGSPGDVLRCLEAVRAAVGGANAEPSDPRETSTKRECVRLDVERRTRRRDGG